MSMMIHQYHCSVCQGSFGTRKEWLSHLLESAHQAKARKEICRWGQSERECVLVAFTTFPIASFDLLQFFSEGSTNLVTDFVWFADRPELGFVQFESRHKVDEILSNFGGPEVRINNQLVQIKKGGDCLELEWQLLTKVTPSADVDEFESILDSEVEKSTSPNPSGIISSSINIASVEEASNGQNGPQNQNSVSSQSDLKESEGAAHLMVDDYHSICQIIEIPDDEYKAATEFLNTLQFILAKEYPKCQLLWFRNWYLKLKTTLPVNELVFFLDKTGIYTNPARIGEMSVRLNNIRPDKGRLAHALLRNSQAQQLGIVKTTYKQCRKQILFDQYRQSYHCLTNDLVFGVVHLPHLLPEIQACRLLSYLCSFDPRVKSMLTVIRYWAKVNNVRLAIPEERSVGYAPDPAALDWLVIFFLVHKKKILPSPREIGKLPHRKLFCGSADIGFAEDTGFAQQFYSRYEESDEELHTFNIFRLARMFFNFYATELLLTIRKLVFNMRDGQIIPMEEFNSKGTTRIQLLHEEWKWAKKGRVDEVGLQLQPNVILLHPLYLRHGFSFCDKAFVTSVCPAMKITGKKLKQALDNYQSGEKFDMRSALNVN